MSWRFAPTYSVRVLILSLSISAMLLVGCSKPDEPVVEQSVEANETIVLQTDSDEWRVQIFKEHLLYSVAVETNLPAPWSIPTREEAAVLRLLSFPHEERFITIDGYTFGMPSANVSKAGVKTRYSVLGLWRRTTVIEVTF